MVRHVDEHGEVWIAVAEVAEILHVSPKTASRYAKEGKLPFKTTLGGHRRFPLSQIRALANELRVEPTEPLR